MDSDSLVSSLLLPPFEDRFIFVIIIKKISSLMGSNPLVWSSMGVQFHWCGCRWPQVHWCCRRWEFSSIGVIIDGLKSIGVITIQVLIHRRTQIHLSLHFLIAIITIRLSDALTVVTITQKSIHLCGSHKNGFISERWQWRLSGQLIVITSTG